jgi:uncharacterized protein YjdB
MPPFTSYRGIEGRTARWQRGALGVAGLAIATLSCGGDALDPDRAAVASVVVVPDRLSVGVGASAPLTAEVRDADGTLLQGRKVVWATKDVTLATVSSSGVVTGVRPGPVQVAATAEGKSAIAEVTVNPKAVETIRLSPSGDVRLQVGEARQIGAETVSADGEVLTGRVLTWSSNATTVASVSETGLITAVSPGGAVITAASEGKSAVVAVTVSSVPVAAVVVTPSTDNVVVTQTLQLTAVATDAQGGALQGRTIAWSTSNPAVATVSSTGLVTGIAPGDVTISASAEGKSGTSAIAVRPKPVGAVIISPGQVSVEAGQTRQLTAQVTDDQGNVLPGRPVTYASENGGIATVSTSGVVTGVAPGATRITATSEGKTGTADVIVTAVPVATVEVTPGQSDLTIGQSAPLTAVARDSRGNVLTGRQVAWTTGAPSVATVSAGGVVTAVGAGNAVVFATIEGRSGSATVNVRQVAVTSVTVAPAANNIGIGASVQLSATVRAGTAVLTDRNVGWSSSNEATAIVSSTGRVTGLKAGSVTITATSEGVSGTASVAVSISTVVVAPSSATVSIGQTRQLTASARDASNTTIPGVLFEWASNAPQVATVDASGLVTARAAGTATIRATTGTVSGQSTITVPLPPVATVDVTPPTATVTAGQSIQLAATLRDANNTVLTGRVVTWSSSHTLRATVNNQGLVATSIFNKGTVTITATSEGKSDTSVITVQ